MDEVQQNEMLPTGSNKWCIKFLTSTLGDENAIKFSAKIIAKFFWHLRKLFNKLCLLYLYNMACR